MDLILGAVGLIIAAALVVLGRRRRPPGSTAAVDEAMAAEHARPYVHIDVIRSPREP